jgi:hypothetical protein
VCNCWNIRCVTSDRGTGKLLKSMPHATPLQILKQPQDLAVFRIRKIAAESVSSLV